MRVHQRKQSIYNQVADKYDFLPIGGNGKQPQLPDSSSTPQNTPMRPEQQQQPTPLPSPMSPQAPTKARRRLLPPTPQKTPMQPVPAAPKPSVGKRQKRVEPNIAMDELANSMSRILKRGLVPLYTFLGMVAAHLGDSNIWTYYKKRAGMQSPTVDELQDPIVTQGVTGLGDFIRKNQHLGKEFLQVVIPLFSSPLPPLPEGEGENATTPMPVGQDFPFNFNIPASVEDELMLLDIVNENVDESIISPAWTLGSVMSKAFLEFLLSGTTLGGIEAALSRLHRVRGCEQFTLKQLIMSDGVNEMFAMLVAYEHTMLAGGNAYGGRVNGRSRGRIDGTTFMLSAGIQTRIMTALELETLQNMFQSVGLTTNPAYGELQASIQQLEVMVYPIQARFDLTINLWNDVVEIFNLFPDRDALKANRDYEARSRLVYQGALNDFQNAEDNATQEANTNYNALVFQARFDFFLRTKGSVQMLQNDYVGNGLVLDRTGAFFDNYSDGVRQNYENLRTQYVNQPVGVSDETRNEAARAYNEAIAQAKVRRQQQLALLAAQVELRRAELVRLDALTKLQGPADWEKLWDYLFYFLTKDASVEDLRKMTREGSIRGWTTYDKTVLKNALVLAIMKSQLQSIPRDVLRHYE